MNREPRPESSDINRQMETMIGLLGRGARPDPELVRELRRLLSDPRLDAPAPVAPAATKEQTEDLRTLLIRQMTGFIKSQVGRPGAGNFYEGVERSDPRTLRQSLELALEFMSYPQGSSLDPLRKVFDYIADFPERNGGGFNGIFKLAQTGDANARKTLFRLSEILIGRNEPKDDRALEEFQRLFMTVHGGVRYLPWEPYAEKPAEYGSRARWQWMRAQLITLQSALK